MDKRYQVFVSSTFEDLQEERKEVMQALLELDCIPAGMELFPASNDDQWSLIKRVIDDCDYYILIIGGRYGSENDKGISYTQMEFEYALSQGKPIISFLHKHPEEIPTKYTDNNPKKQEKLAKFRELTQKKLVRYWQTAPELGGVVSRSMVKLIKDFPAEGWVKAGSTVDETSLQEILRLQRANNELQEKLATISTIAPEGSDKFAQGEDLVEIFGCCTSERWEDEEKGYVFSLSFSWNKLFMTIAPHLIDECNESELKESLNVLLASKQNDIYEKCNIPEHEDLYDFEISNSAFNLIRVQFKALGLMALSNKKRSTRDKATYWTLTPYGDYVMTQLLAVKKENSK